MAKGTIWGSFTGAPTGDVRPAIEWTSTPNVSGNYSDVTASLVFIKYSSAWGSWNGTGHSVSISIAGSSGSASRTFDLRNSSRVTVWSRKVKVNHNSDGRKSIVISASGKTGLMLGNYSFSQSVSLDNIDRNSTLNSASFNSRLETGKANSIKYNISRAQSGYVHQFQLRDGETTLDTWHDVTGSGDGSLTVSSGLVNTIMGRMGSVTSKNFTLRMATRDGAGGSWVGSAETLTIKATIGTVSSSGTDVSVSISGSGYDNSLGLYVEGRTRVYARFSPQASGGATISSSHIVIEKTNGQDKQTINGSSGTSRVLRQSGSYRAQGVAVDSRGVTVKTAWTTFTVSAYSPPAIVHTTAERGAGSNLETTATVRATVRHTRLTGNNRSNEVTIGFYRRESGNSTWGSAVNTQSSSGKSLSYTYGINDPSKPIDKSYDYRIVATDNFGNSNESIITLTTQRVVLDIHKNDGVGIGKVHEQGVLDVDGEAFFKGKLHATVDADGDALRLNGDTANGHAYMSFFNGATIPKRIGYMGFGNRLKGELTEFHINNERNGTISLRTTGALKYNDIEMIYKNHFMQDSKSGTNSFVRFYDGTLICYIRQFKLMRREASGSLSRLGSSQELQGEWSFPTNFLGTSYSVAGTRENKDYSAYGGATFDFVKNDGNGVTIRLAADPGKTFNVGWNIECDFIAIGRWK